MGIKNLLPSLKAIEKQKHIEEYSGKTVGIDAMCWMHQAAYKYAKDLENCKKIRAIDNSCIDKITDNCMKKLRML